MGETHPESPARIGAIENQLMTAHLFDFVRHYEAPIATHEQLLRVHSQNYIDKILDFAKRSAEDYEFLDNDTMLMSKTPQAALRAAGAVVMATDLIMTKTHRGAFCNIRPPGHHASSSKAMGFCFFNNIAIAAKHAIYKYNLSRVAIIDFDVHHGNGTESIIRDESRIMLFSSFEHPFYPYSGTENIAQNTLNTPMPTGTNSETFKQKITEKWLPALHDFKPELIFISAGFDAHHDDGMGHFMLHANDYAWITNEIVIIADKYADGRIISALEGGYNLSALARSVTKHLRILMRLG
jgi:acetoin utilization deacetylase AcuC-like enzyme